MTFIITINKNTNQAEKKFKNKIKITNKSHISKEEHMVNEKRQSQSNNKIKN